MKTEKEKMLAGEVYDCADNELLTRWHKAKQLQQEYNNTLTTDAGKISDLFGTNNTSSNVYAVFNILAISTLSYHTYFYLYI